jgi:hypothetical protein
LLLGSVVDFRVDYGRHFNKSAFVAMVNLSHEALAKNRDVRGRQATAHADPAAFLIALAQNGATVAKANQQKYKKLSFMSLLSFLFTGICFLCNADDV